MLHVILLILRIIGIVLAAILGIVLLLLLLVLFVPIRYRVHVRKREEVLLEARVTWLLHLLSVPVAFRDGVLSVKIKVFGIPLKDLAADEEEVEETTREVVHDTEKKAEKAVGKEEKAAEKPEKEEKPEGTKEETQIGKRTREKQEEKPGKFVVLRKIENLKYTIRQFCGRIRRAVKKFQDTKDFVTDERTKAAVKLGLKQLLVLLKKLLPKKIRGDVHFGTEDPALTGEILGGISIFYPVFMDNVKVIPDFEQACLEGELWLKGRLRMAAVVQILWKLFWDKNIRYVYRKLNL